MEAMEELSQLSESICQAASLLADDGPSDDSAPRRPSNFLNTVVLGNVVTVHGVLLELVPRRAGRSRVGGAVGRGERAAHGRIHPPPLLPRLLRPGLRRVAAPGRHCELPGGEDGDGQQRVVCEKVEAKGRTTYNEVADEIYSELKSMAHIGQGFDEKNIRQRVYDAFNVLIALRVIAKEKKEIRWMGLSNYRYEKLKKLEEVRKELVNKIRHKKALLQEIKKQVSCLHYATLFFGFVASYYYIYRCI
ncbi:transcription factor Dp family member 3-like [Hordeum vulgare subsp. vulgare]|uniref:transcription factor Dp family member 3-like n=1 Tax=Hordeum vulgare subsp. vulgare TaxID=112509 RepID=UPI001D1A3E4A|nr:transcription factor Dp family member 3-like [Hordeum vulgare subsp. vulgare]